MMSDLFINNVTYGDEGEYVCEAVNVIGGEQRIVRRQVVKVKTYLWFYTFYFYISVGNRPWNLMLYKMSFSIFPSIDLTIHDVSSIHLSIHLSIYISIHPSI